jgi:hypothetical protein
MAEKAQLRAADEVRAWCSKCGELRLSRVKAITPKRAPRVICMTCDKESTYRQEPPKTRRKKTASKPDPNPWAERTANVREDRIIPYTISGSFAKDDFLQHKKYGLGVVLELLDSSKMVVAFEDKKRVMVCNK